MSRAFSARLSPESAMCFNRILLTQAKAVSVLENSAEKATRMRIGMT